MSKSKFISRATSKEDANKPVVEYFASYTDGKTVVYAVKEASLEEVGKDKLADYSFISAELRKLLGKMLTIVDASIGEPKQNKAFKDLVKQTFVEEYGFLTETLLDQDMIQRSLDAFQEKGEMPEPVDLDEALGIN